VRNMTAEFFLRASFHACRVLLHAVNLRHGTDGFTSPPKDGVLRILSPLKIPRPGLNPRILGPAANYQTSVAQPYYTRGILNIVEESWRHTKPICHIVEGGGDGCVTFQLHLVDLVCPTIIKKLKTETEQKTR
jgi:hypothetical protein